MKRNRVIVIGGGASGIMAAITAADAGAEVTLIEHRNRIGKKLLATGNGKCNFTNVQLDASCYHSENPTFMMPAFMHFSNRDTIQFFLQLGIYSKNRNGGLYPLSGQATAVLDVLRLELDRVGVQIQTDTEVEKIRLTEEKSFLVQTNRENYSCSQVILACGSKAHPSSGSDGSGYLLARQLGHDIRPVVPALTGLHCQESFFKSLTGLRVDGKITVYPPDQEPASDTGELQLTKYGVSGIPAFQVSYLVSRALLETESVPGELNFMPDFSEEQLQSFLKKRCLCQQDRTAKSFFLGLFPKPLGILLLKKAKIALQTPISQFTDDDLTILAQWVQHFPITICGTNDFTQAQVCSGGVSTGQISPVTLESKLVRGLFFCGEIIDVDGLCGGYNLQWAWSSGHAAGLAAATEETDARKE